MKQQPFEIGKYYHIFNRGNNKQNLFFEPDNYNLFLKLMKKYFQDTYTVFAYCLLPNHFHLLLKINDIDNLPESYQNGKKKIHQPLSNMFNSYSKSINKRYHRSGSLFQKHLHRKNIVSDDYFRALLLYIHLNPVKHKISDNFSDYPYSSYKVYISDKQSMLNRNRGVQYFGDISNLIYCHNHRKINIDILNEIEEIDY